MSDHKEFDDNRVERHDSIYSDNTITSDDVLEVDGRDDISVNLSVISIKSESSVTTVSSNGSTFCRICHQNHNPDIADPKMVSPCRCIGSMANVHQHCLQRWASVASSSCCDICGFTYDSNKKYPNFLKYMKVVFSGKEFTVELVITILMFISTPLIIMATILSSLVNYKEEQPMKILIFSLWSITIFSWILYSIMLYCTSRYIHRSYTDWREKNISIELILNDQKNGSNICQSVNANNCENYI